MKQYVLILTVIELIKNRKTSLSQKMNFQA